LIATVDRFGAIKALATRHNADRPAPFARNKPLLPQASVYHATGRVGCPMSINILKTNKKDS
jgi:hypothetical protein